jgi:serine/threonine-protein kinase
MSAPSSVADRNLILGLLGQQMDLIPRDAFIAALNAWVLDKDKSLGQILEDSGHLTSQRRQILETLTQEHIQAHRNDPRSSLAAIAPTMSLREELGAIADESIQASLDGLMATPVTNPDLSGSHPAQPRSDANSTDRFRALRPHARGGLGEVFVAEDRELHREVALKEIQQRHAHDAECRARFLLEAEITGGLEHPGIVPVYGLGVYPDGRPFYAMRFIQGDTLEQALRRLHQAPSASEDHGQGRLALRQLLSRLLATCYAVAYAHSRGVIHRDLKPANILLGPFGETLVVDWGLAKVVGRPEAEPGTARQELRPSSGPDLATASGSTLGTPAYMSPEAAEGRLELVGPASDVYGLGATLYALLTGRPPVSGSDILEVLAKVSRGDWLPPREVKKDTPAPLDAVCRKALALKPEDRYASVLALAADLEHWLADEPLVAYREPWTARLGRWVRRHQTLAASTAALLFTAVIALAVSTVLIGRAQKQTASALEAEARRRQQARQALDSLSSRLVEEWLARQKDLQPEHREFLEQALASYEEFSQDTGRDESALAGVANAHRRIGRIRAKLGQAAAAEAAFDRAQELYAELAENYPDQPDYRLGLAQSLNDRADLMDKTRPQEAETIYRQALERFLPLVADFPDRGDYRQALAICHNNLGLVLENTGRLGEAVTAYGEALKVYEGLAADFPDRPEYRKYQAASHYNLGNVFHNTTQIGKSEAAYGKALALLNRLAADFPKQPDYRQELARCQNNLGSLLQTADRPREAEAAYRAAGDLQKRLAADFPARPDYRLELARSHNNLADLLAKTKRAPEAEAAYQLALGLLRQLAADFPARPEYRFEQALTYNNLGELQRTTGRPREAEETYRQSVALYRQLATDLPAVPDYRNELAMALGNLGEVLRHKGDWPAARQALEEALPHSQAALANNPRNPFYQEVSRNVAINRALVLAHLGDHAAAAAAADPLAKSTAAPELYNAACLLAMCMPAAAKDTHLSEAGRREQAGVYGDRAMEALRQAVAHGFKDIESLKTDKDLDPLRTREDFRNLLADLEKPKAPTR